MNIVDGSSQLADVLSQLLTGSSRAYDAGVALIAGAVSTVDPSVGQFVEMMAEKKVTPKSFHFLVKFHT